MLVELVVMPRSDGSEWQGYVPRLPGVVGAGSTPDETWMDLEIGLRAALESYVEKGYPIPWVDQVVNPASPLQRSKWVDVGDPDDTPEGLESLQQRLRTAECLLVAILASVDQDQPTPPVVMAALAYLHKAGWKGLPLPGFSSFFSQ